MTATMFSPKLDKFDKMIQNKSSDYLKNGEIFLGAVKLRPELEWGRSLRGATKLALPFSMILFGVAFFHSPSYYVKTSERYPVIIITSLQILIAWNSVEHTHIFETIDSLPTNTVLKLQPRKAILIGSSKYFVTSKDLNKLKSLVIVSK